MNIEDLDDHAPIEPDNELLARVHTRSASFRRRRATQRLTSATAGLVVIALVVALAATRVDTSGNRKIQVPAESTTSTVAPISAADVLGEWVPMAVAGYRGQLTKPPLGWKPYLRFAGDGRWTGSDGCNSLGGTYRLEHSGVHFLTFESTLVGCSNTPDFEPIEGAARSQILYGQLLFFAANGTEVARFARPRVTARIELPSTTMTAGSQMAGHVVIENDTGHVINASGCGSLFTVQLGNASIHPDPAWTQCSEPLPIPVGESSYPVTIWAAYQECTSEPQGTIPVCGPGNTPAPLPAGDYRAQFFQSTPVVTPAPSIDVTVTP